MNYQRLLLIFKIFLSHTNFVYDKYFKPLLYLTYKLLLYQQSNTNRAKFAILLVGNDVAK